MSPNRITNTPLLNKEYNSRAIRANNANCKACCRQADGTLWAVIPTSTGYCDLKRSTDNGFSWEVVRESIFPGGNMRGPDGTNVDGPLNFIMINEDFRLLDVYFAEKDTNYDIIRIRYDLSEIETDVASNTNIELDTYEAVMDMSYTLTHAFVTFVETGTNQIYVRRCSPRSASVSAAVALATTPVFNIHSTCIDEDNDLHMLMCHQDTNNIVKYVMYDISDGWGTPVTIEDFGDTDKEMRDPSLVLDGYGNLLALWSRVDDTAGTVVIQYAISTDSGATWSSTTSLTRTDGHAAYNDSITSDLGGRTSAIGGREGGYIISYVEDNSAGVPKTYVRRLTTTDGSTYTLGTEYEIGTQQTESTDAVVGLQFFLPTDTKLMDLSDPGLVRVAYQVGEGDSLTNVDEIPVRIAQELLYESAFSTTLDSELTSYTLDTADSLSIIVMFNLIGTPKDNIDFYAAGNIGKYTTRYINAFNKIGTVLRFLQYEPSSANLMSDRSAYGAPTESLSKIIIVPGSYGFPTPEIAQSSHTAWMEQDIRQIYLPPDQHLSRTFVVNKGGYLKRTVWTLEYDGNEYEISQVVPYFMDNQICYYSANVYVVGPSRDPWSRAVLTSET